MSDSLHAGPDWFARALGAVVTESTVLVEDVHVAFRVWGNAGGPGVVLIHGGGAHARWWDHIGPLLVEGHRRVAAIDLSGHGDSGRRGAYDLDVWSREVLAVADAGALGSRPIVVGHSMGGLVAMQTSALAGPRLGGVVVVDSLLNEPAFEDPVSKDRPRPGAKRTYATRDAILARFRPVPDQPTLGYVSRHVAEHSIRESGSEWTWKFDPVLYENPGGLRSHVPPIRSRIALIRGEHGLLSGEIAERVRAEVGRTAISAEIPGAGHHIMLDEPLALAAALRILLASWER